MKKNLLLLLIVCIGVVLVFMASCTPEPEFYINGQGAYTEEVCLKDSSWSVYEYHYGYNFVTGRWEYHWGHNQYYKCLESRIDTVMIDE